MNSKREPYKIAITREAEGFTDCSENALKGERETHCSLRQ